MKIISDKPCGGIHLCKWVGWAVVLLIWGASSASLLGKGTTWEGTVSTDWNNPANWSNGVPDSSDDASIKSSVPFNPVIPAGAAVKNFEIKTGGVLNFASNGSLTVHGDATAKNDGTINLGTGTITFLKDITIHNNGVFNAGSGNIQMNGGQWESKNGSTFNAGTSTVTFSGSSNQEIKGDVTFYNVVVNTSGTLEIKDTVVSENFNLNSGSTLNAPDLTVIDNFSIQGNYTSPTTITVNTGANLILLQNNAINDATKIILAGGTFETKNFSDTVSTLTLTADSILDFYGSASTLRFADSSSTTWSGTVRIENYTPLSDKLYVGTTGGGLTQSQLNRIQFINPYNTGVDYYADITYLGEIVIGSAVVPEAKTVFAMAGLALVIGCYETRRRLGRKPRPPQEGASEIDIPRFE